MLRRKLAAERYVPKWAWLLMAGVAGGGGGKEEEGKEGREMRGKRWRGRGRRRGSEVVCGAGILLFCRVSLRLIYFLYIPALRFIFSSFFRPTPQPRVTPPFFFFSSSLFPPLFPPLAAAFG